MTAPTLQRFTIRQAVLDECTMIIAPADDGDYVLHADAMAAIDQAREEERRRWREIAEWIGRVEAKYAAAERKLTPIEHAVAGKLRSMGVL